MDIQPAFRPTPLVSHIIGDTARALCERRDEPNSRQGARAQEAAESMLGFQPGDVVEAMIASHCVVLHEMILDSARMTLRDVPDAARRATRSGIVAMDRAFGANLTRLAKYRAGHADRTAVVAPADDGAGTVMAERVPCPKVAPSADAVEMEPTALPVDGVLPPCDALPRHATTRVFPALDTPDLAAPPQVRDSDRPREACPATVTRMPGLNRKARRAIGRLSRKRVDPVTSQIANAGFGCHVQS